MMSNDILDGIGGFIVNDCYFLGLDMGTNSIGWAVTDENYNLVRKKGKECWQTPRIL